MIKCWKYNLTETNNKKQIQNKTILINIRYT